MRGQGTTPIPNALDIASAWSQHTSTKNGMEYWHNAVTDETTWMQPATLGALRPGSTYRLGWSARVSQTTGMQYWFNSATGETSWTLPDGAEGSAPRVSHKEEAVRETTKARVARAVSFHFSFHCITIFTAHFNVIIN